MADTAPSDTGLAEALFADPNVLQSLVFVDGLEIQPTGTTSGRTLSFSFTVR